MRKLLVTAMGLFVLVALAGCGPLIETLTVKTWPGNATVNVSAATIDGNQQLDFTSDERGMLTLKNVKFAKDASGKLPVEITVSAQYHETTKASIPFVQGAKYKEETKLIALPGTQTVTFVTVPNNAQVFTPSQVELANKQSQFRFLRPTPATATDEIPYLANTVVVTCDEYHSETVAVPYMPGKTEYQKEVTLKLVTEELITDYYLYRPSPTKPTIKVGQRQFWAMKRDTGDRAQRITGRQAKDDIISDPSLVSTVGNTPPRIIFTQYRREGNNLYSNIKSIPLTGGVETNITPEANYFDVCATYDQTNKRIMFSSNRYTPSQLLLYRVDIDNLNVPSSILEGMGVSHLNAHHEVDGDRFLFTNYKMSMPPQINMGRDSDTSLAQLSQGSFPKFAPDGQKIMYLKYRYNDQLLEETQVVNGVTLFPNELWMVDTNLAGRKLLVPSNPQETVEIRGMDWHPNGRHIVFSACLNADDKGRPNFDIYTISVDGRGLIRRTSNESCDDYPVWSEDGNFIYFRSNRGVSWNIWRIEAQLDK